jgi:predicted TIM-barrel fold metal-dependent hydrolase
MKRRQWMTLSAAALAMRRAAAQTPAAREPTPQEQTPDLPERLLLKDYRPQSIYRVPKTDIQRAKHPIVDAHCHGARPIERLEEMVKLMDTVGVAKVVVFTGTSSADRFGELHKIYSKYPSRFDLWCGFDLTGADQPGFGPNAVKALEDCHRAGALGVGEVSDKGWGFRVGGGFARGGARAGTAARGPTRGSSGPPAIRGPHADDPRMDGLWDKCAQLGMPINIHVSDPIWSYRPMDASNDGLMNAYTWRIDDKQPGILGHDGLIQSLERAAGKHPKTIFIACHLANLDYDLTRLGQMFDRHPNLYADISARFGEIAPIPRFVNQFLTKYQDRVLYGTDMTYSQRMFSTTFRILESRDEHFYERDLFNYHWPLYGLGLPDAVLRKLYGDNARRAFRQAT